MFVRTRNVAAHTNAYVGTSMCMRVLLLACVIAVLVSVALTAFYLTSVLVTFIARPLVFVQFRFALTVI